VIEPGSELLNLRGFTVIAYAAQDEDSTCAGVGEEQVAIGRGGQQARHGEGAAAWRHHLLVVRALHGRRVPAGVEGDLEARRCLRPRVLGALNDVRLIAHCFFRLRLGQVGERDLATDAGLLLVPVSKGGLAGDGLLRGDQGGRECCGCAKGNDC
jgi:hypothetical protein